MNEVLVFVLVMVCFIIFDICDRLREPTNFEIQFRNDEIKEDKK
jgi:hypothetical protein